jgi:hypothetical protein
MQTDYEPHPIALEYPPLSAEDLGALRKDIVAKGLIEPIVLFRENGASSPLMILDGWHRYQACVVEGIEPDFEEYTGDDPAGFAQSKNFHRRHLNLAQRKAHAKKLAETNPDKSSREIGRQTGLTHHTVEDIRRKLEPAQTDIEDARPALVGRKGPGRPALTAAEKEARKAAKETDQDIAAISVRFHTHIRHALETVVAVVEDRGAAIQEKVPAAQRRELLAKFAIALGFRLPSFF